MTPFNRARRLAHRAPRRAPAPAGPLDAPGKDLPTTVRALRTSGVG